MKDFEPHNQDQDDDLNHLQEGLNELRLRAAVEQAAQQRRRLQKTRLRWLWVLIVFGVLCIGGVLFSLNTQKQPVPSPTLLPPDTAPGAAPTTPLPATEKQASPLASNSSPSPTLPPKTQLRSIQKGPVPTEFLSLIDTFLIETRQNNTHLASNPTWLKIVRLLEGSQPAQAKTLIFSFESQSEESEWLLGVALLEEGKTQEAFAIFESIARRSNHPRQSQAENLLRLWPSE